MPLDIRVLVLGRITCHHGLPRLDLLSSISTNFCWEPGKSTANNVSTLPRSLRRGFTCFKLNTKLSFLMTSSTWRLASEIQTIGVLQQCQRRLICKNNSCRHFVQFIMHSISSTYLLDWKTNSCCNNDPTSAFLLYLISSIYQLVCKTPTINFLTTPPKPFQILKVPFENKWTGIWTSGLWRRVVL